MPFARIEDAVEAFARGEILVVVDDEDRENEGDLIMAAEFATPEKVAFFLHHTSGYLCVPITAERAGELDLPPMVVQNTESQRTAFLITVDYRHGTSTGISAYDRCATVQALCDPATRPGDLARPGHINPLMAREGGVLKRAGHTEATVDLCHLAGLYPAGLLCEIVDDKKTDMARVPELERFAVEHDLLMISIADLVRHRRQTEKLVRRIAEARIPTKWGDFTCYAYESLLDGEQHVAMVKGTVAGEDDVLVRVHSECLTGDAFGSLRCDCGVQLDSAMQIIAEAGHGVVVYLRGHEGRGIGIGHKIAAYNLQERGLDTVDANLDLGLPSDSREYGIGAQILVDLGITTMRLITNNPTKRGGLEGFGLEITERVPSVVSVNPENLAYMRTKRERMGHLLEGLDDVLYPRRSPSASSSELFGAACGRATACRSGSAEPPLAGGAPASLAHAPARRRDGGERARRRRGSTDGLRIGVVARWNSDIVDRLAQGVGRGLAALGVDPADVVDETVAGSFELPMGARILASSGRVDAVICLGCVIRGETSHYELVAGEAASGIQQVQLDHGRPGGVRHPDHRGRGPGDGALGGPRWPQRG